MLEKIILVFIALFGIYLFTTIDNNAKSQIWQATTEIPSKVQNTIEYGKTLVQK